MARVKARQSVRRHSCLTMFTISIFFLQQIYAYKLKFMNIYLFSSHQVNVERKTRFCAVTGNNHSWRLDFDLRTVFTFKHCLLIWVLNSVFTFKHSLLPVQRTQPGFLIWVLGWNMNFDYFCSNFQPHFLIWDTKFGSPFQHSMFNIPNLIPCHHCIDWWEHSILKLWSQDYVQEVWASLILTFFRHTLQCNCNALIGIMGTA